MIGSTISDNSAGGTAAASSVTVSLVLGGNVTVIDSTISGNSASDGGGIFSGNGDLTVTGSTISGNSAGGSGGGICSTIGNVTMIGSTISGNSAGHRRRRNFQPVWPGDGHAKHGQRQLCRRRRDANGGGGGISSYYGDLIVNHSTISGNSANAQWRRHLQSHGRRVDRRQHRLWQLVRSCHSPLWFAEAAAASSIALAHVTVTRSTISGNSSIRSDGGGIASPDGQVTITDSTISGNSAAGTAAALPTGIAAT